MPRFALVLMMLFFYIITIFVVSFVAANGKSLGKAFGAWMAGKLHKGKKQSKPNIVEITKEKITKEIVTTITVEKTESIEEKSE